MDFSFLLLLGLSRFLRRLIYRAVGFFKLAKCLAKHILGILRRHNVIYGEIVFAVCIDLFVKSLQVGILTSVRSPVKRIQPRGPASLVDSLRHSVLCHNNVGKVILGCVTVTHTASNHIVEHSYGPICHRLQILGSESALSDLTRPNLVQGLIVSGSNASPRIFCNSANLQAFEFSVRIISLFCLCLFAADRFHHLIKIIDKIDDVEIGEIIALAYLHLHLFVEMRGKCRRKDGCINTLCLFLGRCRYHKVVHNGKFFCSVIFSLNIKG